MSIFNVEKKNKILLIVYYISLFILLAFSCIFFGFFVACWNNKLSYNLIISFNPSIEIFFIYLCVGYNFIYLINIIISCVLFIKCTTFNRNKKILIFHIISLVISTILINFNLVRYFVNDSKVISIIFVSILILLILISLAILISSFFLKINNTNENKTKKENSFINPNDLNFKLFLTKDCLNDVYHLCSINNNNLKNTINNRLLSLNQIKYRINECIQLNLKQLNKINKKIKNYSHPYFNIINNKNIYKINVIEFKKMFNFNDNYEWYKNNNFYIINFNKI